MILIKSHQLKTRNVKVKTGLLAIPITTHANPKIAQVYDVTIHNQPAAKEEVEAARTIGKADKNINYATINDVKVS